MDATRLTLLDKMRSTDDGSWREAHDLYHPLIFSWVERFGVERQDAEDLTQDVLFTLLHEIENFEHCGHLGAFRGWLKTVTLNRVRAFYRSGQRRPSPQGGSRFLQLLEELEDSRSPASLMLDQEHDHHLVQEMLRRIGSEFSEVTMTLFRWHVVDGRDAAGVGREMGVTKWAVYQAKSRVLRRLRERIGPWTLQLGLE